MAGMDTTQGTSRDDAAPHEYAITAQSTPGSAAWVVAGGQEVSVDTAWGSPGGAGPGPAELLCSAFAACLLKNLDRTRALMGFRYDGASVAVTARRQDAPPRFTEIEYTLRVRTDETDRRLELAHLNLRKFGTVYNTLAAVCDVHGTIERSSDVGGG